jgi:Domain of unknown function (DUF1844)
MPEEPEEGFIVRDRRRAYLEEPEGGEPSSEPSKDEPIIPPAPAPPVAPPVQPVQPAQPSAPSRSKPQFGFPGVAPTAPPPPAPGFGGFGPPSSGQNQSFGMPQGMQTEMQQEPERGEGDPSEVPHVFEMLSMFLNQLFELSMLRLGLLPNPITGELEPDLGQAGISINTLSFIAKQLEPALPPEERVPLQSQIQELQRHYMAVVQKLQESNPGVNFGGPTGNNRGGII